MRHFRNPRFAPESLERKLNPSTPVGLPVMAEVSVEMASVAEPQVATVTVVYQAESCTFGEPTPTDPGHPMPGDPEPLTPPPGTSDPGPGDGDPPTSHPSLPGGGGGEPA